VPSIHLTPAERQDLLARYHRSADPEVRLRSHILLLLDAGHPWVTVGAVLFCSASTISRWKRRFEAEGVETVFGRPRARRRSGVHIWATLGVRWVLTLSPTDFRFVRSLEGPKGNVISIRGSGEWRAWVGRLADHSRLKVADVIDRALLVYAKQEGFTEPAPRR
jgi:hypothetical protein